MEQVLRLESEFARFAGYTSEQMVACNSGTSALHLALEAMQLPQGSEVILCDYNMVACARAVTLAGLKPVFVDCNEKLLIDPNEVAKYLESGWKYDTTKAILCTHIYGRACDMQAIHDIAAKYDLRVIEDLAETHGVPPHPNTHAACWSFYKNKIIAGEEGGAVAFRDEEHAAKARQLRSMGFGPNQDYQHMPRGHNYRLANALVAPIMTSLACYKQHLQERREMETAYDLFCPEEWKQPERQAPWVFDIRILDLTRLKQDLIVKTLKENRIAARHGFKSMIFQDEYAPKGGVYWISNSQVASNQILYLPLIVEGDELEGIARHTFNIIKSLA